MPSPQRAKNGATQSVHPSSDVDPGGGVTTTDFGLGGTCDLAGTRQDLHAEGIGPKLPVDRCLTALAPILRSLQPSRRCTVKSHCPKRCAVPCCASPRSCRTTPFAPKLREPLSIEPPRSARHGDTVRTGALLLEAYRDAVRRGLRGKTSRESKPSSVWATS